MRPTTLLTSALLLLLALPPPAAQPARAQVSADSPREVARGTLSEIRERRRAALIVHHSRTVSAHGPAHTAVEAYTSALGGSPPRSHAFGQRVIAKRLNKYIRKYRSMTAAPSIEAADFVLVFNVTTLRRSFIPAEPYVYGSLFVILPGTAAAPRPRVVWASEGEHRQADDVVNDFVKALKAVRGEK